MFQSKQHAHDTLLTLCKTGYCEIDKSTAEIIDAAKNKDINLNSQDRSYGTYLICAAKHGQVDVIKDLILSGATLNEYDFQGFTALSHSFASGSIKSIQYLLNQGATHGEKHHNLHMALYAAICYQNIPMITGLSIFSQIDLNFLYCNEQTPLMLAIGVTHIKVAKALIFLGAKMEFTDPYQAQELAGELLSEAE